jgi:UDP-N-acetylmuramoylalanine--D-glutamate ligase
VTPTTDPVTQDSRVLIVGYGLHGQAVATALCARSIAARVVDDRPGEAASAHAVQLGVELIACPDNDALTAAVAAATHVVPTPGLPDHHSLFGVATELGRAIVSEFDLAAEWDHRPLVAITGTNGKTTVTTMVTEMLVGSGINAVMAGNMEVPLVTAIDDHEPEVFVVEASSFRLGHSSRFAPLVGTWLNLEPDHLDVHASLTAYESAKARIWANQSNAGLAIGNAEDPIVMASLPGRDSDITFGGSTATARVADGQLIIAGELICAVSDLARSLPHDISNALAAAATAIAAGAEHSAVREVLESFGGLEHRVQLVADQAGIRWYNDSKATTPHAVMAGVGGFDSAVLIAGGRNKGVDLTPLRSLASRLRAVVAIGEAAPEIADVFDGLVPVVSAPSMEDAVRGAGDLARSGDVVVLSPACTSYDWYANYGVRGDDFMRLVGELLAQGDVVSS